MPSGGNHEFLTCVNRNSISNDAQNILGVHMYMGSKEQKKRTSRFNIRQGN